MTLGTYSCHVMDLYDGTSNLEEPSSLNKSLLANDECALAAFGEIGTDYFHLAVVHLHKPFLSRLSKRGLVPSFAGAKEEILGLVEPSFDVGVNEVGFRTEEQLDMMRAISFDWLRIETDVSWYEFLQMALSRRFE